MKDSSLFKKLFFTILLALSLLLASSLILIIHNIKKETALEYDGQLISDSHTVWMLVREDLEEGDNIGELLADFSLPLLSNEDRAKLEKYANGRAVRIWKKNKLAAQTDNLKKLSLPKNQAGFSNHNFNGEWRVYTVFIPKNNITVEIWENLKNRQVLLSQIIRNLIEPAIILLPILVIF